MLNGISIYHGVCHPPHGSASRAAETRCTSQAAPVINSSSASPALQPGHPPVGAARGIPAAVPPPAPGWGPQHPFRGAACASDGGSRRVAVGALGSAAGGALGQTPVPCPSPASAALPLPRSNPAEVSRREAEP